MSNRFFTKLDRMFLAFCYKIMYYNKQKYMILCYPKSELDLVQYRGSFDKAEALDRVKIWSMHSKNTFKVYNGFKEVK